MNRFDRYFQRPVSITQQRIINFIHINTGYTFYGSTYEEAYVFVGKYRKYAENCSLSAKRARDKQLESYHCCHCCHCARC